ncbi:hypothetical protein [Streptosporangium vulgare]|uniref:Uncharacterized protein n=1 Tax=Streptosporangium vulgare TaxID=46190 RepID=A0ABV5TCS3_9ACTN
MTGPLVGTTKGTANGTANGTADSTAGDSADGTGDGAVRTPPEPGRTATGVPDGPGLGTGGRR